MDSPGHEFNPETLTTQPNEHVRFNNDGTNAASLIGDIRRVLYGSSLVTISCHAYYLSRECMLSR